VTGGNLHLSTSGRSGSQLSLNDGTSVIAREELEQATQDYNDSGALPYV